MSFRTPAELPLGDPPPAAGFHHRRRVQAAPSLSRRKAARVICAEISSPAHVGCGVRTSVDDGTCLWTELDGNVVGSTKLSGPDNEIRCRLPYATSGPDRLNGSVPALSWL